MVTVREYLLGSDLEKVFEIQYAAEAADVMNQLSEAQHRQLFEHTISEIRRTKALPVSNRVMIPERHLKSVEYDEKRGTGEWIGNRWFTTEFEYSISLAELDEIRNLGTLPAMKHVSSLRELKSDWFPYPRYDIAFSNWDTFLDVPMLCVPDDEREEYAAAFYRDMTFCGHSVKTHAEGVEEVQQKLAESEEDIRKGNCRPFEESMEELRKELGFEKPSREEQEAEERFEDQVLLDSCNLFVEDYNALIRPALLKAAGIKEI